ncbi:hypothetical protein [Tenacibaculum xiamenense]|uniref:hypothetical protein n=1 Tax=Tenacibaculum xiamenense TaxID=1261553 RepID=UPI0038B4436C
MKKNISNLGKVLTPETQRSIQGGFGEPYCYINPLDECRRGYHPHPDPMIGHAACCKQW